jgi:hypothetical protein
MLREGRFRDVNPELVLVAEGGKLLQNLEGTGQFAGSWRKPNPGDGVDPMGAGLRVLEVRFPMELKSHNNETFTGTSGVRVAKRPADNRWVIIGFSAQDVPRTAMVVLPPS